MRSAIMIETSRLQPRSGGNSLARRESAGYAPANKPSPLGATHSAEGVSPTPSWFCFFASDVPSDDLIPAGGSAWQTRATPSASFPLKDR